MTPAQVRAVNHMELLSRENAFPKRISCGLPVKGMPEVHETMERSDPVFLLNEPLAADVLERLKALIAKTSCNNVSGKIGVAKDTLKSAALGNKLQPRAREKIEAYLK